MTALTLPENALLAAHQAVDALAVLMRYVREGPFSDSIAFEEEVGAKLAEALGIVLDIEATDADDMMTAEGRALATDLRDACARYIAGWKG